MWLNLRRHRWHPLVLPIGPSCHCWCPPARCHSNRRWRSNDLQPVCRRPNPMGDRIMPYHECPLKKSNNIISNSISNDRLTMEIKSYSTYRMVVQFLPHEWCDCRWFLRSLHPTLRRKSRCHVSAEFQLHAIGPRTNAGHCQANYSLPTVRLTVRVFQRCKKKEKKRNHTDGLL